jgi:hypothetical protein
VLDLFVEYRVLANGLQPSCGWGLLGALVWFGQGTTGYRDKHACSRLWGNPSDDGTTIRSLLESCEARVECLIRLFHAMISQVDLPRALLRGRYMVAVAEIETAGVPIDAETLTRIRRDLIGRREELISRVDADFGVFRDGVFEPERWEAWVRSRGIPWPSNPHGEFMTDDETFRGMARVHPEVALLRELRHALVDLRVSALAVGSDGRNRTPLRPFRSKTGRNQPSSNAFVLGSACWVRGLIKPEPGMALAYLDWSQQEFAIAAALSGDRAMQAAYLSGDPYLAFGKQAGRIPSHGTEKTHGPDRELFKTCALGVLYGMGAATLAQRIGRPIAFGQELHRLHRRLYPQFWDWSDGVVEHALLHRELHTVFGWKMRIGPIVNPCSLRNFPCQANGAEMLQWACWRACQLGVRVVAPLHDALLIEAPEREIDDVVGVAERAMQEASEAVLEGFQLRSRTKVVRWPDRYCDDRGLRFWELVMAVLPTPEPIDRMAW